MIQYATSAVYHIPVCHCSNVPLLRCTTTPVCHCSSICTDPGCHCFSVPLIQCATGPVWSISLEKLDRSIFHGPFLQYFPVPGLIWGNEINESPHQELMIAWYRYVPGAWYLPCYNYIVKYRRNKTPYVLNTLIVILHTMY